MWVEYLRHELCFYLYNAILSTNGGTKMSIMIKLFLLIYLLAVVLLTIFTVIWILTAIVKLECVTKKALLLKYLNSKSA
jgi:hypothetical protein